MRKTKLLKICGHKGHIFNNKQHYLSHWHIKLKQKTTITVKYTKNSKSY